MNSEIRPNSEILLIGRHHFDPGAGTLTGPDGSPARLRRQSLDVLSVLAASPGEIVGREDLIEKVWKGVATTDDSLIQCISDIRRVLGKGAIETFPKVGYRLAARPVPERGGRPRSWTMAAILMGAFLVAVAAWQLGTDSKVADADEVIVPPRVLPEKTLAVLPFVNLGGGEAQQYFGDGLSEDLTTDLAKISDLTVISYASSADFSAAEAGFRDIAEDLGVRYLVRGTVRHSGDRVRINVSLIDPFEGVNIWAERFDRVRRDPFDLQEDVTRAIVQALSLTLESEDTATHVAPDAYFMLLRGLEPLRENTISGNAQARRLFAQALELDPNYARAHAYIAVAYGRDTMFDYSGAPQQEAVQKGLESAITAIQLDPGLPNAYLALAILNLAIGEHEKALAAARHSIRLNRNFADGYAMLAEAGVYGGDLEEALEAIRHAKRLHPHHPPAFHWIEGHILFHLGKDAEARPLLERTVELSPGFIPGFVTLAAVYSRLGDGRDKMVLAAARAVVPDLSLEEVLNALPYATEDRRGRLGSALAGVGKD